MRSFVLWVAVLASIMAATFAQAAQSDEGARDLRPFLEGIVYDKMDDGVPSAMMIAYIHGDEEYAGAYGMLKPGGSEPVDETSLFRYGSISKLFVWIAVMQQVEQGKLDLDEDINTYLGRVRVPDTYDEPITMRHIMAHKTGFEANSHFGVDRKQGLDREATLIRQMPSRVAPPGERMGYSNFGSELAAYAVERLSGLKFEDYVAQRIAAPLGMTSLTYAHPGGTYLELPANLDRRTVRPVKVEGGRLVEDEFGSRGARVAQGAIAFDARDALRFLRAVKDRDALLGEESWAALTDEGAPMAMSEYAGFGHYRIHGHHAYGHLGRNSFSGELVVVPALDLAIVASANTRMSPADNVYGLIRRVAAYVEGLPPGASIPVERYEGAQSIAGNYMHSRRSYSTPAKFVAMGEQVTIAMTREGDAIVSGGGPTRRLRPTGPDTWAVITPGYESEVRVERDGAGKVLRIVGLRGAATHEPVARWQTARTFRMTLGAVGLLSITTLLGAWYRRGRKRSETERGRKLAVVPVITAAVWLALLVGFVLLQMGIANQADDYPTPMATFVTSWALVAVLAGIAHIVATLVAWVGSGWSPWRKLHASLYALALGLMIAILDFWNAFGRPFLEVT